MAFSNYLGHEDQISGIEEYRLVGGKGDGLRLLQVRNGLGLQCSVSLDRCADIPRLTFMGMNMGYFSPCGFVGSAYYDRREDHWLKSFTAGFLTTCGLTTVGGDAQDGDEFLPMHGTIGNTPAEHAHWYRKGDLLVIEADMKDCVLFGRKLQLHRVLEFSTTENKLTLTDTVENHGSESSPVMVLYHMNMGYPLLSEQSELIIPSDRVIPRNAHAAEGLQQHLQFPAPTPGYEEQCYFHEFDQRGLAKIYNHGIGLGLAISFDPRSLNSFCQWKMPGEHDYVLGLEPGNCTPDGRVAMREQGRLQMLDPGEKATFRYDVVFYTSYDEWKNA